MSRDEWNKADDFLLEILSPTASLGEDLGDLDRVLDVIESIPEEIRPNRFRFLRREFKYSRQKIREKLHEETFRDHIGLTLSRAQPPDAYVRLSFWKGNEDVRFSFKLTLAPFAVVREPASAERYARHLVSIVRAVAARFPISYGLGHSRTDFWQGLDKHQDDACAPKRVYEAYWLNVYGPRMVEALGREHLLSTPAHRLEELPNGAVLWLTRPTPADFDAEEARQAQARALVHLRPEYNLDTTLQVLRERSLTFQPIPIRFHEDVADMLLKEVDFLGLRERRQNVERFNSYQPPPVTEWLPAAQAPAPDVEDMGQALASLASLTRQCIHFFKPHAPAVKDFTLEALAELDSHLYRDTALQGETLVSTMRSWVGAWLGSALVHGLGGRWVPRRTPEEIAVVLGDRAWLPFLRARHALSNGEGPLDFSCSQFFREAQRLASAQCRET